MKQLVDAQGDAVAVEAAACLAVQFDAYLRPTECLELRADSVVLLPRWAGEGYNKIALVVRPRGDQDFSAPAKNRDFDNTVILEVNSERSGVAELVRLLVIKARARWSPLLFPNLRQDPGLYERALRHAAASGLASLKLTTHTARLSGRDGGPVLPRRHTAPRPMEVPPECAEVQKHGTLMRQPNLVPDNRRHDARLHRRDWAQGVKKAVSHLN